VFNIICIGIDFVPHNCIVNADRLSKYSALFHQNGVQTSNLKKNKDYKLVNAAQFGYSLISLQTKEQLNDISNYCPSFKWV